MKRKYMKFVMRVNDEDKANFRKLADYLQRSQADAIRFLVHDYLVISGVSPSAWTKEPAKEP